MEAPVFFYYEVREFYQTHRLYVQSREEDQLTGKEISNTENCKEKNTGMDYYILNSSCSQIEGHHVSLM